MSKYNSEIAKIKDSGLFDTEWYLRKYPDTKLMDRDPIEHYLWLGSRLGRNPCPLFDTSYYLKTYPDIAEAGINPLVHYLEAGAKEGRDPNPLFDTDWYLDTYPDVAASEMNPLAHYLQFGHVGDNNPNPLFDTRWYLETNPDVAATGLNPLIHYLDAGEKEGRNPNPLFDTQWYLKTYSDVAKKGINPLAHYITHGRKEGRRPFKKGKNDFGSSSDNLENTSCLSNLNTILKRSTQNMAQLKEDLQLLLSGGFDPTFYLETYPEARESKLNPAEHYLCQGWQMGLNPTTWFSTDKYVELNPEVMQSGLNPFVHFIRYGREQGKTIAINLPVENVSGKIIRKFPVCENPLVTIIIPVFNQWQYTRACLLSLADHTDFYTFPTEVIIADDGSSDETLQVLDFFPGVRVKRTPNNMGFGGNCNHAATRAQGKYILFLNNDTRMHSWWLESMLDTYERHTNVGIVGGSIIYPDNVLQAAGGAVHRDGRGLHFGQWSDQPNSPEWHYVRDVIYTPGSFFMISRELWEDIGGFDRRFVPAYCEDVDLCLEAHKRGARVVYQPFSRITHYESKSFKKDARALMDKNTILLKEKWLGFLSSLPKSYDNFFIQKDFKAAGKKTIVVFDYLPPEYDKHAGGLVTWQYVLQKRDAGFNVKFVCLYVPNGTSRYLDDLRKEGVEAWSNDVLDGGWRLWFRTHAKNIDLVVVHRPNIAQLVMEYLQTAIGVPVVFFGHDLHFVRMRREMENDPDGKLVEAIEAQKAIELKLYASADLALTPSPIEVKILKNDYDIENEILSVQLLAYPIQPEKPVPIEGRRGLLFVGSCNHPPNPDGLQWFLDKIWPILKSEFAELTLSVVGSGMTPDIIAKTNGVTLHGYVSDKELDRLYKNSRVVIAPLRFGAGVKGKVLESMKNGVPVVGTTIAMEGIPYYVDTGEKASDFTSQLQRLIKDDEFWLKLSLKGIQLINQHFSWDRAIHFWRDTLFPLMENTAAITFHTQIPVHSDAKLVSKIKLFDYNYYLDQFPSIKKRRIDPLHHYLAYGEKWNLRPAPFFFPDRYRMETDLPSGKSLFSHWIEAGIPFDTPYCPFQMPPVHIPDEDEKLGKHVLIISPVSTETNQGNSVRVREVLKELKALGYIIHYLYYPFDEPLTRGKAMLWDYVYELPVQGKGVHRLKYDAGGKPLPDAHLIDDWCGPELCLLVNLLSRLWHFDICICNYVWLSKTLLELPEGTFKIIDTHDKFSHKDKDVAFALGMEHNGWYSTTPNEEKDGLLRADHVVAIQEEEADYFKTLVGKNNVSVVGVRMQKRFLSPKAIENKLTIGYLAGVNPFNLRAIKDFYTNWSENGSLNENTRLLIGGLIGSHFLKTGETDNMEKAEFVGEIENVEEFYEKCDLIVNPDFGGTGLKIKTVEGLSFGRPLLVTRRSTCGLPATHPGHIVEDLDAFMHFLEEMITNPEKLSELAAAGKELFNRYDAMNNYSEVLQKRKNSLKVNQKKNPGLKIHPNQQIGINS